MAIHSSILAWRIPWTEEGGNLLISYSLSLGLQIKTPQKRLCSLYPSQIT